MARAKRNGSGTLDEAMAALTRAQAILVESQAVMNQNQAASLARMAATDAELAALKREANETNRINSERFARIEAILAEHGRILQAFADSLRDLPNAIRDKIGSRLQNSGRQNDTEAFALSNSKTH